MASASAPLVSVGFVFEGLTSANKMLFESGISARATELLNGPTTPSTAGSAPNDWMFFAPCAGSCTPLTASPSTSAASVKPGMSLLSLACLMASCAPYCVGTPIEASAPDTGRSMPILMTLPAAPPAVEVLCCEQPEMSAAASATPMENVSVDLCIVEVSSLHD